ncbi:SMP-30/gluconolactonase/LRE family protein [Pseudonocardia nematodicida]|uniref:SMP-30/gluconolactonase/LRE family protein n=1 Tax=Pseudonocardia nematodicida TaxID=1206997 RepID=A0ABV1K7Q7_9PSEU
MTRFEFAPLGAARSRLGENPTWRPDDGELWHVDVHNGLFRRTAWATGATTDRKVGERVTFVLPAADGSAIVSVAHGLGPLPAEGEAPAQLPIETDLPHTSINDGKVDPRGRLWFDTLDRPQQQDHCALYRLDAPDAASVQVPGVLLGNGLGWSPAGDRMYFVDSRRQRIDVFDYDLHTGSLGERRVLCEIPEAEGMPDGLAVDAEGSVWVALYGGWQLHRYTPDGTLADKVAVPVRYPTCPGFAGPDLRTLVVTTAYAYLQDEGEPIGELDGAVLVTDADVPGLLPPPSALSLTGSPV